MSEAVQRPGFAERIRHRWQIPALLASSVALVFSLRTAQTARAPASLDPILSQLDMLVTGEAFEAALRVSHELMQDKERSEAERAAISLRMARALSGLASRDPQTSKDAYRRIAAYYARASEAELSLGLEDHVNWAKALEREGFPADAAGQYERAVGMSAAPRWDLMRHVYELRRAASVEASSDLRSIPETILAATNADAGLRVWALEELVELLHELGDDAGAVRKVAELCETFDEASCVDRLDYLKALTLYRTGGAEEAEMLMRAAMRRGGLSEDHRARGAWLLGTIVLGEDGQERPQEATAYFEESLRLQPEGPYACAARLGLAQAFAALQRDDEAVEQIHRTVECLAAVGGAREADEAVVRRTAAARAGAALIEGRSGGALKLLDAVTPLISRASAEEAAALWEQLGKVAEAHAQALTAEGERLEDEGQDVGTVWTEAVRSYRRAGESYLALARLSFLDELRVADAHLQAAEMFAAGQAPIRAGQLFGSFVAEHPSDPRVPLAMLRQGQIRQGQGDLQGALGAYRECVARFPRTLYGAQALIPLAQTYVALAKEPEDLVLADRTLERVLDDPELFRPESREFSDALFLRGTIASLRGEHERAIATLTEALDRYPEDARRLRATFLLADAYRQSALALKRAAREAPPGGRGAELQTDALSRLDRARGLFREVVDVCEPRFPDGLDRLEQVYFRHALLFEADCLFEALRYDEALKLYQAAGGMLADRVEGLPVHVQIINCQVFLGRMREARAALTRARIQLERLDDARFAESFSQESKAHWRRYFDWLDKAELF